VKRSQRKLIGAIAVAGVLIVAASAGIWAIFLTNDAPEPVSLEGAVASLETPTAQSDDPTATATATLAGSTNEAAQAGEEAAIVWGIAAGSETFVGYRIGEELATIGASEAVGRSSSVTGSVTISGSIVESATVEANLLDLESDDNRRDQTLQNRGLETASYPTATFTLTEPIDLGGDLVDGAIYSVLATGELTLHGVTQPVEIGLEAQYSGGSLVIVGSLDIELADYEISPPTTAIALAVDDHGTVEMQLILDRSG